LNSSNILPAGDGAAGCGAASSDQADFRLRVKDGSVWITTAMGVLNTDAGEPGSSPRVQITDAPATAHKLFDALWSLARANNLVRLASLYPPNGLISVSAERYSPWARRDCPEANSYATLPYQPGTPIKVGEVPEVTHCDMVKVKLRNLGQSYVDAIVLYIDARGGIQPMSTWSEGEFKEPDYCSIALPPGAKTGETVAAERIELWDHGNPSTAGREYVIVIAAARPESEPQTCFGFLVQSTLDDVRGAAATGPQSTLQSLLEAAALGKSDVRGGSALIGTKLVDSAMSIYPLEVTDKPIRPASATPSKP
jgi:hypothetical protein